MYNLLVASHGYNVTVQFGTILLQLYNFQSIYCLEIHQLEIQDVEAPTCNRTVIIFCIGVCRTQNCPE